MEENVSWKRCNNSPRGFVRLPVDQPCYFAGTTNGCYLFANTGTCNKVHSGSEAVTGPNYKANWDL